MTKAASDRADSNNELSEAARAVVRDQGDPRIDAHLAALGLAPDSEAAPGRSGTRRARAGDIAVLQQRVAELEAALEGANRRVRLTSVALTAALIGDAVFVLLLLTRLG